MYRMSERKDTLSLATLAFLLKRHHVREGRQGREVRRELMVWPLPRKAAEECVGGLVCWPGQSQDSSPIPHTTKCDQTPPGQARRDYPSAFSGRGGRCRGC